MLAIAVKRKRADAGDRHVTIGLSLLSSGSASPRAASPHAQPLATAFSGFLAEARPGKNRGDTATFVGRREHMADQQEGEEAAEANQKLSSARSTQ